MRSTFSFRVNQQREIKFLFAFFLMCCFCASSVLSGAPHRNYDDDSSNATREMRDSIESLRHEVNNHETEIRTIEQRADNQEATLSSIRQQILDANQVNKDLVKGNATSLDSKIANLEAANKGLIADLSQLKTHANDSATVLAQYKQKIAEMEKVINLQNQSIDSLQVVLKSLVEAMNTSSGPSSSKSIASSDGSKVYKVKNGDNLEKVARANNTTIKVLKELNDLTNDRIIVGQTLKVP